MSVINCRALIYRVNITYNVTMYGMHFNCRSVFAMLETSKQIKENSLLWQMHQTIQFAIVISNAANPTTFSE